MKVTYTTTRDILDERVKDLLTSALEGGSNYWYVIQNYIPPPGKESGDFEFPHVDLPLSEGGCIIISDQDEATTVSLNRARLEEGLQVMADKFPKHFQDFLDENDDANTGDVFLQCCVFGNVIYG